MKNKIVPILIGFLTIASGLQAAEISLLECPVIKYNVGFGDLWIGKNVDHKPVILQGKEIQDYLFAHAPSRILYDIPAGVTSFSAWGVRPSGDDNVTGSWIYIVKIDGKEAFRSKPLETYETYEVPINVAIPSGSKTIELIIDDMGNNYADHSIWGLPKFK